MSPLITTVVVVLICVTAVGVCVVTFKYVNDDEDINGSARLIQELKLTKFLHPNPRKNASSSPASPSSATTTPATSPSTSATSATSSSTSATSATSPTSPALTKSKRAGRNTRCGHLPRRRRRRKLRIRGRSRRQKRIVNGDDVIRGQFPWVVMVLVKGKFFCGGSIIGPGHVLTAAHCLRPPFLSASHFYNASDVEVIAGKHVFVINNSSHDVIREQRVSVRSVILHHKYNGRAKVAKHNDLAILELRTTFKWTEWVSPICLPKPTKFHLPRRATVVGWGSVAARNRINWLPTRPQALQQLRVRVRTRSNCLHRVPFDETKYMTPRQICAVSVKSDDISSTCYGDSGGPLFVKEKGGRHVQFGVVSWGYCVPTPGVPSFFTYLPHFLPWIRKVTGRKPRPMSSQS